MSKNQITSAGPAQALQIPFAGTYAVEATRSRIDFTTRALLGLSKVTGRFVVRSGEIVVSDQLAGSRVQADVDASSFQTNNAKRDKHVRSKALLDAEQFPTIAFHSAQIQRGAEAWIVDGVLTAHGKDAPLTLTVVSTTTSGDEVRLEAIGRVDRYAHGVTYGKGMAARYLELRLIVCATRIA